MRQELFKDDMINLINNIQLLLNASPVQVQVQVTQSCLTLRPHGIYSPWSSPGQNTGVGGFSLLQGIFPTQGLNPGLLHCKQILFQQSHQGSQSLPGKPPGENSLA